MFEVMAIKTSLPEYAFLSLTRGGSRYYGKKPQDEISQLPQTSGKNPSAESA